MQDQELFTKVNEILSTIYFSKTGSMGSSQVGKIVGLSRYVVMDYFRRLALMDVVVKRKALITVIQRNRTYTTYDKVYIAQQDSIDEDEFNIFLSHKRRRTKTEQSKQWNYIPINMPSMPKQTK